MKHDWLFHFTFTRSDNREVVASESGDRSRKSQPAAEAIVSSGEKSPLHSMTPKKANKQRKVVRTPDFAS